MTRTSLREFSLGITLLRLLYGLWATSLILSAFFCEVVRGNAIELTQGLMAGGIVGKFVLFVLVVFTVDACWQIYFATYNAKGINRRWFEIFRTKYAYQKWLKPIYVVFVCFQIFGFILSLII